MKVLTAAAMQELDRRTIVEAGAPIVDIYSPELIAAQGELAAAIKMGDTNLLRTLRLRFERWNLADVADHLVQGGEIQETVTIRSAIGGQVIRSASSTGAAMPGTP